MKPPILLLMLCAAASAFGQKPTYNVVTNYDLKLYEAQNPESKYSYIPSGKPFKVASFGQPEWNRAWFNGKFGWIHNATFRGYTGADAAPALPDDYQTAGARGGKYVSGNGFGLGADVYFSKSFALDLHYKRNQNLFHLGFYRQYNGQKGATKTERLSNYGLTTAGSGSFYAGVNLGYTRLFRDKFGIGATVSLGSVNYFQNFVDRRFTSGYYNLVYRKESAVGFGGNLRYFFTETTSGVVGYNTRLGGQVGIAFTFY
jgi:hypothetical protein